MTMFRTRLDSWDKEKRKSFVLPPDDECSFFPKRHNIFDYHCYYFFSHFAYTNCKPTPLFINIIIIIVIVFHIICINISLPPPLNAHIILIFCSTSSYLLFQSSLCVSRFIIILSSIFIHLMIVLSMTFFTTAFLNPTF